MRETLIDIARVRNTEKRGHPAPHVTLSVAVGIVDGQSHPIVLAQLDVQQAKLVELRYFGCLGNWDLPAELGISESTVVRTWRVARAWLFDCLQPLKPPALNATPL